MSDFNNYSYELLSEKANTAIIKVHNHALGGNDALSFNKIIDDLIQSDVSFLIIDCSQVELMNSSGLGMLVSAFTNFNNAGKKLFIINVPDKIKNLLKITHLDQVLKIYENKDDALNSF